MSGSATRKVHKDWDADQFSRPTREGDTQLEVQGMAPIPEDGRYGRKFRLFTVWFAPNLVPAAVFTGTLATADFIGLSLWWNLRHRSRQHSRCAACVIHGDHGAENGDAAASAVADRVRQDDRDSWPGQLAHYDRLGRHQRALRVRGARGSLPPAVLARPADHHRGARGAGGLRLRVHPHLREVGVGDPWRDLRRPYREDRADR